MGIGILGPNRIEGNSEVKHEQKKNWKLSVQTLYKYLSNRKSKTESGSYQSSPSQRNAQFFEGKGKVQ